MHKKQARRADMSVTSQHMLGPLKQKLKYNVATDGKYKNKTDYSLAELDKNVDMKVCTKIINTEHKEFDAVFRYWMLLSCIYITDKRWCETISGPTKACDMWTVIVHQKELEWLQKQ